MRIAEAAHALRRGVSSFLSTYSRTRIVQMLEIFRQDAIKAETYSPPRRKTALSPHFFFRSMFNAQITGWGRMIVTRSLAVLMLALAMCTMSL